jgi:hypothetical protein
MGAILDPQRFDLRASGGRVGFIPDMDVAAGEIFGVGHDGLSSGISCGFEAGEPTMPSNIGRYPGR